MSDNNKLNLQYFEGASMRELYTTMQEWQESNNKRLLSISIQPDDGRFCCVALTNPTEVMITGPDGNCAFVSPNGSLYVFESPFK